MSGADASSPVYGLGWSLGTEAGWSESIEEVSRSQKDLETHAALVQGTDAVAKAVKRGIESLLFGRVDR